MANPTLPARLPDYYSPPANYTPPMGSLSRPSATKLEEISRGQVEVIWNNTSFNKTQRVVYGTQRIAGRFLTYPVINGAGNLVVAIEVARGTVSAIRQARINNRPVPAGVGVTIYKGDQVNVVDPTLAAAITGYQDRNNGLAYVVFEIPPATVEGFPQQAQFMFTVDGIVTDANPAPKARYWRIMATETNTNTRFAASSIRFMETPGGPNVATGGTGISSSGTASSAFGTVSTAWQSGVSDLVPDAWVGYDAGPGNEMSVEEISISTGSFVESVLNMFPIEFLSEYSTDGAAWITHNRYSSGAPWGQNETRVYTNSGLSSENPARSLEDFVTNSTYGMGDIIQGAAALIEYDDEMVGDPPEPRCRSGFVLSDMRAEEILDLIVSHAEGLWSYDGPGIFVVPDGPVDEPADFMDLDDIQEGTFRFVPRGLADRPSSITVIGTDRDTGDAPWTSKSENVQLLSGYDVSSVVPMPGVYRNSELRRKGSFRIRRLSAAASFAWQHVDEGIKFQRGDVVQLPSGFRGASEQQVRVMSVAQVAPGRYQVAGDAHSNDYYSGAIPVPAVDIPVGAIIPYFSAEDVPDGWERYEDGDGLPLRIDAASAGSDTGDAAIPHISGTTLEGGRHKGSPFYQGGNFTPGGTTPVSVLDVDAGGHSHTFETTAGDIPHTMSRVERRLIEKVGADGLVPTGGAVFADGPIINGDMTVLGTHTGRVMGAGDNAETGDNNARTVSIVSTSSVGNHSHGGFRYGIYSPGFTPPDRHNDVTAGSHSHSGGTVTATVNARRRRMAVYVANTQTGVVPGAVVGFNPALPLPSGWEEFDLPGYLIEIAAPENAGVSTGDDTVTWSGQTTIDGAHTHKGSPTTGMGGYHNVYHDDHPGHSHSITGIAAFQPLAHCLRFIQYTGV